MRDLLGPVERGWGSASPSLSSGLVTSPPPPFLSSPLFLLQEFSISWRARTSVVTLMGEAALLPLAVGASGGLCSCSKSSRATLPGPPSPPHPHPASSFPAVCTPTSPGKSPLVFFPKKLNFIKWANTHISKGRPKYILRCQKDHYDTNRSERYNIEKVLGPAILGRTCKIYVSGEYI